MPPKKQLIVVGDRILIESAEDEERTEFGLYLPPGVKEKQKVRGGYVVKVGPGYPMPDPSSMGDNEPWSQRQQDEIRYIPLQAQIGDYAIFLNNSAIEIEYDNKQYLVVPQSAILVLMRDDLSQFSLDDEVD